MAQSSNQNGRVWVMNLPLEAQSEDIEALFSGVGTVLFAEVLPSQGSEPAGLGFVCFAAPVEAERAVEQFNGYTWHSHILQVMSGRPNSSHCDKNASPGVERHRDHHDGTIVPDPWVDSEGSRTRGLDQPVLALAVPNCSKTTSTSNTVTSAPPASVSDRLSQSNIFPNASGVIMEGNNVLSSAGRNLYNIQPSVTLSIHPDPSPPQTSSSNPPMVGSNTHAAHNVVQASSSFMGEHFSETYARLLLPKGLGWPLWLPSPLSFLPEAYRTRGVCIGDVGIITKDGDFDFFFNICLPADDPINRNSVPDNFVPICHPRNPEDVRLDSYAWAPGDYVVTSAVTEQTSSRSPNNEGYLDYHFNISSPSGALLSMPMGGRRKDLLNTAPFVAYAKKHAPSWYKHINVTRGRGAANGSVYLITGVDKTQIWGTGVYSQPRSDTVLKPLTFRKTNHELSEESHFEYIWNRHLFAMTRHGPPKENFNNGAEMPHNQCTFLRGFRVALAEGLWSSILGGGVEVSPIRDILGSLLQKSSNIPFSPSTSSGLSTYFGFLAGASTTPASNATTADLADPVSIISDIPTPSTNLHPSDAINFHLLNQNKQAEIAVTHDQIWCSVLDKDAIALPNHEDMLARIQQKYAIVHSDGCISFEPKDECHIQTNLPSSPQGTPYETKDGPWIRLTSPPSLVPLLVCSFCCETFEDYPTTLSCGHSVCSKHVENHNCDFQFNRKENCLSRPPPFPPIPNATLMRIQSLIRDAIRDAASASPSNISELSDDTDTSDNESRPRKRQKRWPSSTSSTDDRFLPHISARSGQQRFTRTDQPSLPPTPETQQVLLTHFHKELFSQLSCAICFSLFYCPVTTPCQHTFCSRCLHRSLDHASVCPICREELPQFLHGEHPTNTILHAIILDVFPEALEERKKSVEEEERDARLDTPIFVCHLTFPGMPTLLHFFEPRYRLMLRRCLQSDCQYFGMIMSSKPGSSNDQAVYGTMLEIRSVQPLPDGRSMVEAWGTYRFRILESGTLDGYLIARIERIDDYTGEADIDLPTSGRPGMPIPLPTPSTAPHSGPTLTASSPRPAASSTAALDPLRSRSPTVLPSNAVLMERCISFLNQLERGAAPWIVQRLYTTFGQRPSDVATFSFWIACILPMDDFEKAKLLPIRSPRLRMLLVVHWIEQLNSNWWVSSGCVIQ